MHSKLDFVFAVEAKGGTPSDRKMGYPSGPAPAAARARFLKNRPSKRIWMFDPILVPTCVDFCNPKDRLLDRYFSHLGSILGAKLGLKLPIKRPGKRRPTERYGK